MLISYWGNYSECAVLSLELLIIESWTAVALCDVVEAGWPIAVQGRVIDSQLLNLPALLLITLLSHCQPAITPVVPKVDGVRPMNVDEARYPI